MKPFCIVLTLVFMLGCASHRIPKTTIVSANPISLPEYSVLVSACQKTYDRIQKAQDTLDDKANLVKNVSGIVTGGVGVLGSTVTGVLAAKDRQKASTALGITTAGLSLVGTLVAAFYEPGKLTSEYNRKTLTEINEGLGTLNNILDKNGPDQDKWSNEVLSDWYSSVGKLKGICQ